VWQRKLAEEWAPLLQLEQSGRMPAAVMVMLRVAHDRSEHAEALHRAGKLVGAYGDMLARWVYATAANQTYAVIGKLAAGDPPVSVRSTQMGDAIYPGESRWYLVYYRDPGVLGSCPATSTFNSTQTGQIAWSF